MNGIIHNCTHKDAGEDVSFRLSEEEMFIRIFNYIEHLFGKIKPKQLFFMAIDGVAPRAKMNQQRARRFRTALDVEKARDKAISEGVEMPKEEPFDSNCITPGTEFMAKLSQQLRYFVNKKVSEDTDWQGCEIVLSGHEVPGEGEHKIMEYIRNAKAQPGYNSNIRHCLYGLDADLIMLGLLSHDPHFCLLREEVTFGRASKTKSKELEHQNFYLLHLCIVREYLEMEFQELKQDGVLSFPFDLERVIDDFILMAFFVGNDFLPNLHGLHINEGALANMFRIYKTIIPKGDGYINENGVINMDRLQALLGEISNLEVQQFEDDVSDEKWFVSKQMEKKLENASRKTPKGAQLVITSAQRDLWKQKIRPYVSKRSDQPLDLGADLIAADRKFVQDLAESMHLQWSTKEDDEGHRHLLVEFPPKIGDDDDEEEEEGNLAAYRVTKTYDKAMVIDLTAEDAQKNYQKLYQDKYQGWKTKYYLQKFEEWAPEKYDKELLDLCENYVQGLQWVLYYYYRGIASWPWFYKYHYAPLISDVVKGVGADLNFQKGQPFKPYEQLMGVLPDRSKKIVPKVYHDLMTNPESPIIDFYPRDFELDMNGKKMDWEAVVKIPFIDEKRLLSAMATKNDLLEDDEKARNGFGVPIKFTYNPEVNFTYPSPLPGIFPEVQFCHCIENIFDLPDMEGLQYLSGLTNGALLNVSALAGFPTLHTLPYTAQLVEGYGVNVFQSDSRNPSVVVTLTGTESRTKTETWKAKLGQRCFVGYPFLQEAKVMRVQDELFSYELAENGKDIVTKDHNNREAADFAKESDFLENWHSKRLAITIGQVECLVVVHMLKGLLRTEEGALIKEYAENPSVRSTYAAQTIVDDVVNEDERFIEKVALPIEEEFPQGTRAFFLGEYAFGRPLEITGHINNKAEIVVSMLKTKELDFAKQIIYQAERNNPYTPSFAVAKQLGVHPLVLSKITSSYQIINSAGLRLNLGLNLKFEGRKLKVLGYSRKSQTGWEFSGMAIKLIADYMVAFPDFFAGIQREPQKSDVSETDLWNDPSVAGQRVKEIVAWLKKQETGKFERVPLEAEQLDSEVVMALASVGEQIHLASSDIDIRKLRSVPRSALLKPSDAEMVLGNQNFALGDRVTYVTASGKVPIATRGTVVGISRTATALLLDVVWDTSFMSGTTLGERAPMFRGQTVASSSVLNTSVKQVISTTSKSQQRRNVPAASGAYGSVGVTQYKDAPAPAPLRGGWRGALNGTHSPRGRGNGNGGRGGAPNLMHSTLVYRNGPEGQGGNGNGRGGYGGRGHGRGNMHGSPGPDAGDQPQEQRYGNVPPPASLDQPRGRGRGRGGRGRGRGGPNRGRGGNAGGNAAGGNATQD
ncbi:XRN 5'-3' exonuclease N-terminus-domain-containing protein [Ilyonectria robusta]|uniref:XRN 5'-3' exonuclease N-terminus-domain-containing protein n=1 Tax=Ilyonectria robusta TaxID=1079257 RepID=UPI001E8DA67A|nr:XRN 5'-3' exonuclease N-terminus-domain-containing protein [Ilyonectria robusta]KAH8733548.1 XRN 5'-3' exonuclease N-terminus-domain-containing protein [Ilyonectria robusta]